jgi:CHAD domain-containing protein
MSAPNEAVERGRERTFDAPDHIRIPDLPDATVVEDTHVRPTATYWDTVQRRLLRWGYTSRQRRASGSGTALFPRAPLRTLAGAIVHKGLLEPIGTIIAERHGVELTRDDEERVRLGDDHMSSVLNGGATPTGAAKIEPVPGRGSGDPEISLPRPCRKMSIEDLLRFAIGSGATRLIVNDPAARVGADPEAIHQARVATRRLRSDLKTLEPLADPAAVGWIRDELAWVGELLGSVRDTDVLIERVRTLARELHIDADAAAIVTELQDDRRRRQVELLEGLESGRYVRLVQILIDASAVPPLGGDVDGPRRARPRLRKLAGKSWRRLARGVKRLGADPSDAELHEIRKRAKRARYAAELAAGALREDGEPFAERLAGLQDVLGALQDAVVADERLTALVRDDRLSARAAFAAGKLAFVVDEARSDARDGWPKAWKAAHAKRLRRWLA